MKKVLEYCNGNKSGIACTTIEQIDDCYFLVKIECESHAIKSAKLNKPQFQSLVRAIQFFTQKEE